MTGLLSAKWIRFLEGLRADEPLHIARRYFQRAEEHYTLLGLRDASQRAYAAAAYLCNSQGSCSLVVSKTRVAPLLKQTVPRLELLGAVLLSRLISSIREGLRDLIQDCTDTSVTLHWIKGTDRSWKPFIQNRVMEIRGKVPIESWRHCSGRGNPADLPSRGTTLRELQTNKLWFYGPDWYEHGILEPDFKTSVPPECLVELRARDKASLALTAVEKTGLSLVLDIKRFSHCEQLLRTTACILSFLVQLKRLGEVTTGAVGEDTYTYFTRRDLEEAEVLWIKEAQ